jgi:hypothetical protein
LVRESYGFDTTPQVGEEVHRSLKS